MRLLLSFKLHCCYLQVRAACIHALGSFMSSLPLSDQSDQARTINHSIAVTLVNTTALYDASPIVRMELAVALQFVVLIYESSFTQLIASQLNDFGEICYNDSSSGSSNNSTLNATNKSSIGSQNMNSSFCNSSRASSSGNRSGMDPSATVSAILSPSVSHHLNKRSNLASPSTMYRASSAHSINTAG